MKKFAASLAHFSQTMRNPLMLTQLRNSHICNRSGATALVGVTGTLVVAVPSHRSLLDGAAPLAGTQCGGR
ncbi:hypothetical protein AB0F11_18295 [Streptomyces sp. NPDC032472]|uniref:hypothetical protein n=1 Tax=Streptomyces sp. NPDC032472 TaxID=3155018 RepID=UPI00340D868F